MRKYILLVALSFLISCQNQQSVQEYLVAKQNDPAFKTLSLTPNLLTSTFDKLTEDEIATLKKVKSVNLAFLVNDAESEKFSDESKILERIMQQKKYKSLMRINANDKKMNLLYIGDPEAIDELLFYGNSKDIGLLLARINSHDLEPNDVMKIVKMAKDFDLDQLEDFIGTVQSQVKAKKKKE
ncbi:MAG: DUF4252 domain-containing protein [Psychroflexus sp.]|nr:DUF4252 domain-containing protein [Psychroflexus sp.]MDN6309672.1 DUF4252 domain-containing protein [Psychroflexus sp.]